MRTARRPGVQRVKTSNAWCHSQPARAKPPAATGDRSRPEPHGEPYLIRYNSRLPIVVYAPEGVEVRYRLWIASPEVKPIDQG